MLQIVLMLFLLVWCTCRIYIYIFIYVGAQVSDLVLTVSQGIAEEGRSSDSLKELLMHIEPVVVPDEALAGRGDVDLLVGNETVAGKAAAAMAGAMRPQGGGHGKYPLVRAMGSVAAKRALIAGMLAQRYLDNDGRGVRFCMLPYWSRELASEQNTKQLVFRLIHLPKKEVAKK